MSCRRLHPHVMQETGVDGVTIARGAIGNPWIFSKCVSLSQNRPKAPKPTLAEQKEVIMEHYREALEYYGTEKAERVMMRFAMKYASQHPTPKKVRHAFASPLGNPLNFLNIFKEYWG